MDGRRLLLGRRLWSGGDVEGCGLRICANFPLTEFANILSRKEAVWLVLRA